MSGEKPELFVHDPDLCAYVEAVYQLGRHHGKCNGYPVDCKTCDGLNKTVLRKEEKLPFVFYKPPEVTHEQKE